MGVWRNEDEALLERLEDEQVLEILFRSQVGPNANVASLHARGSGLVAMARTLPGGADAVRAALQGDAAALARMLDAPPLKGRPPELLHHLALYHRKVALALEAVAPDASAAAWTRSIAAWFTLAEERAYLARLESAVVPPDPRKGRSAVASSLPLADRVPTDVLSDLGKRAEASTRGLEPAGRAALLALAQVPDAARLAEVSEKCTRAALLEAERRRNSVLDSALAVVADALDDANVRGELGTAARPIMARVVDVWHWSGWDEAVEQFAVDKLATVGWELYRARDWTELRALLDPFRAMFEHLASRIERDPHNVAYAAPCAQMFVFLSDVDTVREQKIAHAEHAVRLCPTHRNGRLVLAALLCQQAMDVMRGMTLFVRQAELDRVEATIARAESLYESGELPEAKAMFARVKKGRITL